MSAHGFHARAFPGRFRPIGRLLLIFLVLNTLVRAGLLLMDGTHLAASAGLHLVPAFLIGLCFDLCVGMLAFAPLCWLFAIWPQRRLGGLGGLRRVAGALLLPLSMLAAFVAAAEFTFWQEFGARFNFIAVEYLVYGHEVIGNIRESYDLRLLLPLVALAGLLIAAVAWRWALAPLTQPQAPVARRWRFALAAGLLAPLTLLAACDVRLREFSGNAQIDDLAGNGYFEFWHAFRFNAIDYARHYRTLPPERAAEVLARTIQPPPAQSALPFERDIRPEGPARRLNLVLVSIESLSASFLGAFGNTGRLTPNLDRLAADSLLFTQLYATGTRTVRGLEALTLSVPPTPGHAIVKRPRNEGLGTLGGVLAAQGYEPIYLYGGYGYFDNMNAFFGGNGYTVVDRNALRASEIHFENIWGVADEDLFTLGLREIDARLAAGKPFFAHLMTTSNHRPFTYPDGRIDIPSRSGREGGVKYTDWAIGRFLEQARTRPWFDQTVFVFVADHTHKGRGRQELSPEAFHIPMLVYAPSWLAPARVDTLASQIDVAPTLLGLMRVGYRSRFFGHDILREGRDHPRAFLAHYQTVGYLEPGRIVELRPNRRVRVLDAGSGVELDAGGSGDLIERAIAWYQGAAQAFDSGQMRWGPRGALLPATR
jgi:phosphoglycerol transferase MdoB-like AlkP superfamily enzyme